MKYVITLLIMILALSSCVGEKRKHEINADKLTMYINPHETLVVHPFDSLFKKRKVVKLETTNESLIGRIDKLVFYKGDIYILDKKQNKIFVFDKLGVFQRVVNHFGQGHGEYTSLVDFQIEDDLIYLLDQYGAKLLVYDLDDKLIKIEKARKAKSVAVLDEGYAYNVEFGLADNTLQKDYYSYYYVEGEKEYFQNAYNKNLLGFSCSLGEGHNSFYKKNGTFYTHFPFNDTIYNVENNGMLQPYQVFKIGDLVINKNDKPEEIRRLLDSGISRSIFAYYDFHDYSFFSYYYGDEGRKYVLVSNSGEIIFNTNLNKDADKVPIRVISCDTDVNDNTIISMLYPFELFTYYEHNKDNEYVKSLLNGVEMDSNPILVYYSFNPNPANC